ncbi:MAG: hypothetical protein WKF91_06745 [Segetibacter sp.]
MGIRSASNPYKMVKFSLAEGTKISRGAAPVIYSEEGDSPFRELLHFRRFSFKFFQQNILLIKMSMAELKKQEVKQNKNLKVPLGM